VGDKRSIIGLILCFLAIFVYFNFVLPLIQGPRPKPPPAQRPATRPEPKAKPPRHKGPTDVPTTPAARATTAPARGVATITKLPEKVPEQKLEDNIVCETNDSLFRVVLTNRGAAVKSITLRDFYTFPQKNPRKGQGDLRLISEIEKGKLSLTMADVRGAGELDTAVWERVPNCPVPKGCKKAVQFRTVIPERGLEIVKTFGLRNPEKLKGGGQRRGRDLLLEIAVTNHGERPTMFQYRLRSAAGIVPEPVGPPMYPGDLRRERAELEQRQSRDVEAVVGGLAGDEVKLKTYSPGKVKDHPLIHTGQDARPIYAGVKNRYFAAVLEPMSSQDEIAAVEIEKIGEHNVTATLDIASERIPPGGTSTKTFMLFVAPRIPDVLRDYPDHHFEELLAYSWPRPITRLLSWLLRAFGKFTPNYGWAIVLLTIVVRVVLHPLTLKSQKSAHKMQKIQPLISAAKEKYKHDKRQQQQEVMKIMREQGANPLGGCLPMLLQLPIFIGLWRALYQDASLRHAPFMLWINDLSKADNLFSFSSPLPIIGRSFNLLPLLCAGAMIINQKMMGTQSQNPQAQQQQKMMMIMPVVFAFLLYGMPSGLMVYFLMSSIFGIVEQRFIRRRLDALAADTATAGPVVPVEPKREQKPQKPAPQRRKKRRRKR